MPPYTFHLISHTHWDREWYLPRARLLPRLVEALDGWLDAATAGRAAPFLLDGQVALLADYLAVRPERRGEVTSQVRAGLLATGPWWVLPDGFVPSAESLVRNLLRGTAMTATLGGRARVCYAPDAFGHPAALPALAREFGMEWALVWRGYGGARDVFRWRAPDGRDLRTCHLSPDGYEIGAALPTDPTALARAWPAVRHTLVSRASTSQVAVFVGADHHAPRLDLDSLRSALARLEPDATVLLSSLADYVAAAARELGADVAPVRGELRRTTRHVWVLQGVHGTRLPLKRAQSRAELWLERGAEPLAAMAGRLGDNPRYAALLRAAWEPLIANQFHDTSAGTVADSVAREAVLRVECAVALGREIVSSAMRRLTGYDPDAVVGTATSNGTMLVFNPRALTNSAVVTAEIPLFLRDVLVGPPGGRTAREAAAPAVVTLIARDGSVVPTQVLGRRQGIERRDAPHHYPDADAVEVVRVVLRTPAIGGLAIAGLRAASGSGVAAPDGGVRATEGSLEHATLRVTPAPDGAFALATVPGRTALEGLAQLESEPDAGDCYTAELPGPVRRIAGFSGWSVLAGGPLLGAVHNAFADAECDGAMTIELRDGEPFVRLMVDYDNRGRDRRLRLRFPLGKPRGPAVAGSAFVVERRAQERDPGGGAEQSASGAPAQRYVAAAGSRGAIALLAPGHFEYEWTEKGDLCFTLLRSVGELSRGDLAARPGHAAWPTATPEAQCIGPSRVELAIAPLPQAVQPDALHQLWERAFLLPAARLLRGAVVSPPVNVGITLQGDGLVVSAIKPSERGDAMVLRAVNLRDAPVAGRWIISPPPASAARARADETPQGPASVTADGVLEILAGPHEIVTYLVR
jgi:alpha-mannosidase